MLVSTVPLTIEQRHKIFKLKQAQFAILRTVKLIETDIVDPFFDTCITILLELDQNLEDEANRIIESGK